MKTRADRLLVEKGMAETRQKAQALIMAGLVYADDVKVEKAGQTVDSEQNIKLRNTLPYVGRGGLKLEAALEAFQLDVSGRIAADLGASTGGFTDCLLQKGAAKVYAVDVDDRQLDWNLRKDPRIVLIRRNARYLRPEDFPEIPELVSMDLSFISVLKVLPAVRNFMTKGTVVALIKPQFEAGRSQVGKGGIIRNAEVHLQVLNEVILEAGKMGFVFIGLISSPIFGQKGNREFLVHWNIGMGESHPDDIPEIIREVVGHGKH